MEKTLLQLLLNHQFFCDNKSKLVNEMFPDQFELIYKLICESHEKYERNITINELRHLLKVKYPVLPQSQLNMLQEFITDIGDTPDEVGEDVAKDVIHSMWKIELGRRIAQYGMDIVEGKKSSLSELADLIDKSNGNFVPTQVIETVDTDLDTIIDTLDTSQRWKFNIPTLAYHVPGLGAGEFAVAFARPEIGKTAFHVSLTFGPEGFLHQGAKTHIILNEESAARTISRGIVSATGLSIEAIRSNRDRAKELYNPLRKLLTVVENSDLTPESLERYCLQHKPEILIIDQIDKLKTEGGFAREDQEMGYIYVRARETAKRHGVALLGLCQASNDAEGKTIVHYSMMAKSKTDKAAELDLAIGIGAQPQNDKQPDINRTRYLTVSKNKLTGWHGTVNCLLNKDLHRYVV